MLGDESLALTEHRLKMAHAGLISAQDVHDRQTGGVGQGFEETGFAIEG